MKPAGPVIGPPRQRSAYGGQAFPSTAHDGPAGVHGAGDSGKLIVSILKRLEARHLLHKVIGNTLWQLIDKVLRLGMGLLVGVWVARYLGLRNFGLLNYAIAFVSLFGTFADGGMQAVIVRDLVHRGAERPTIVSSALAMRLCGAVFAIVLACFAVSRLRPDDPQSLTMVFIVSLSLVFQAWDVIDYEHQSRLDSRPIVATRAISFAVFSLFKVILILAHAGPAWFAWAVAGEAALSAGIMRTLPEARRTWTGLARVRWSEIRYLLRTCWPLTVAGVSVMLYMRIDQVMLGQMLGDRAVGTFSAAVRVSESWYFLPAAVLSSVAPALTATMRQSEDGYRRKLLYVSKVLCWMAIGVALILSVGSRQVIAFLYGRNYADAAAVLVIHAWAGVFVSLGVASGPWFVNGGLLTLRMIQTVAGAVVNIAMNLVMIPSFGVVGAAWSTLVSYAISAFVINAFSARTRPIFVIQLRALVLR